MNSDNLLKYFSSFGFFDEIKNQITSERSGRKNLVISTLCGAAESLLINELIKDESKIFVLASDDKLATELSVELELISLNRRIILLNDFKAESIQEKLTEISNSKSFVLISTYQLLSLQLPNKKEVERKTTKLEVGGNITYDDLIEYLNLLEYQQDKFVEAPGEFSQRGSIIDFWSYSESNPVRLEFDGDFLESIRHFDPESQRSIEKIDKVTLAAKLSEEESGGMKNSSDIFEYLDNPLVLASKYEIENFKLQPEDPFIINSSEDISLTDFEDDDFPQTVSEEKIELKKERATSDLMSKSARWILQEEIGSSENKIELGFADAPTINSNYEILFSILKNYTDNSFDVMITAENELQSIRLKELLSEFKKELSDLIDT
ncbi:MAG: transcription-repair coupling factor, partial [Ignavibacteriaceae bacterium]